MKRFRLLFYKPDKKDGSHVDDLIGGWTLFLNRIGTLARLDFEALKALKILLASHEELWLPSENNGFVDGDCWTSTMGQLGGKDRKGSGVACRPACEVLKHPDRWFYAEFEVRDFGYKMMMDSMRAELKANQGYDKSMIARFFVPMPIIRVVQKIWPNFCNDKQKWICSEFTNHHALIGFRYSIFPAQSISPAIFYSVKSIIYQTQTATRGIITNTMSPLLTALSLWRFGINFYNLDGSLLLAGKE